MRLIFKTLRKEGKLRNLEPLLNHENNTVVSYAAQYLLIEDEKKTIKALKNLVKKEVQIHLLSII